MGLSYIRIMSNYPEFTEEEIFNLTPIFANSVINITQQGNFHQILTYDYIDETSKYKKKIFNDYEFYEQEIENITRNMQKILDNCVNSVNGHQIYPLVYQADIEFKNENLLFFYWIIKFKGDLKSGLNVYESNIEEEELEYNVQSIYILENPLKPISVSTVLHFDIIPEVNMIKYFGNKGEIVGPKEIIRFQS